jgi:hypothetical protein
MSLKSPTQEASQAIAEIATGILSGSISFISGARRINAIQIQIEQFRHDPDLFPFVAVDSETDTLPIEPDVRTLWSSAALEKLQPEIDRAERWAREALSAQCKRLIERFKPPNSLDL